MLGIGNGRVRAKFEALNRKWRSSSQVRRLESEMEEFEPSSDAWNRKWWSSSQVPTLGIGNGGVRAKFEDCNRKIEEFESNSDAWNRDWKSSSKVLGLDSGMEEFESSSWLGIGNGRVRA